ncbi:MAG: GlxA family transcriptional regulator [Roseibium sp.]|uniref:GlxA family transcriptional regulator n=1 Tax=Roseibium sp. TaxID=1936156 RepID=UPI0026153342|nr:GlxA family transcriptional regulator [Roseibium sp.]MCV0429190.1 GlxA family transcriptional regulator [Roseibium sp.]
MQFSKNSSSTRTICVLLFANFSNHCLANAIEPFRAANTIASKKLYVWHHLSMEGGTVTSSSGLPVETHSWVDAQPSGEYLFVMPSYGFTEFATPRMSGILRSAQNRFETLVGMDTGAWLFAKAGLLEGRKATIHWDEFTRFQEMYPDVDAVEDRFVLEKDIATCGGASTAFELMLELIKYHHSSMFALEIAALFMHGDKLEMHDPFQRLSSDALVRSATALMRRTIEKPISIPELAARLQVNHRSLEEYFQNEMKLSPFSVYRSIRLREARRLVEMTTLSIAEIAERCGYLNASAMTRAYRLEFGQAPRKHRKML